MIPEVQALERRPTVIRIPNQMDVPVTARVLRLIDTSAFGRLSRISQLGMVSHVYPGAKHTRFEHSLGVYRNALLFVRRIGQADQSLDQFSTEHWESLIVAGLLHDVGHWPWCHPIEDIGMTEMPKHETVATSVINDSEIAELIDRDWSCDVDSVVRLIVGQPANPVEKLLCSILSGPIDIDKMDYLYRDSQHCGVPYGMNFDAGRLINSICLNRAGDGIAITKKGKTAAEMMVFARYVMFSEVYWHHAVRSATVMFQRAFHACARNNAAYRELQFLAQVEDTTFAESLKQNNNPPEVANLLDAMFGTRRKLYKRLLDYNANEHPEFHAELAHRPFDWLVDCGTSLAERLSKRFGIPIDSTDILIDAPPPGLEVQFRVEVNDGENPQMLADVSPVVKVLAQKQFDDFVKRVRVFIHPRLVDILDPTSSQQELAALLELESGGHGTRASVSM